MNEPEVREYRTYVALVPLLKATEAVYYIGAESEDDARRRTKAILGQKQPQLCYQWEQAGCQVMLLNDWKSMDARTP